jgi:hypothetical protein
MSQLRSHLVILAAAVLLSGCSFVDNTLMPIFTGDEASQEDPQTEEAQTVPIAPSAAEQNAQPTYTQTPAGAPAAVGSGNYSAAPATPGAATGTYVGQKVAALRGDLQRLQTNVNQHNQELQQAHQSMASDAGSYYSLVASINSRLQVGTTPGNPQLVQQWAQAQSSMNRLGEGITRLSAISTAAASDSALASYILESVRAAYNLQGAVDEDHRQLTVLENDCNRTKVLIDKLLNDLTEDINRQSNYVGNERRNLNALSVAIKNGELYGQRNLANRAVTNASAPQQVASATPAAAGRQPLMVIRFDHPNVAYEQALYSAVSRALERRPGATFDVVAVTRGGASAGQAGLNTSAIKRNAEAVVRSLSNMGLPSDRIHLAAMSTASAQGNEVQVFVR